jgi:hypothetical protein
MTHGEVGQGLLFSIDRRRRASSAAVGAENDALLLMATPAPAVEAAA